MYFGPLYGDEFQHYLTQYRDLWNANHLPRDLFDRLSSVQTDEEFYSVFLETLSAITKQAEGDIASAFNLGWLIVHNTKTIFQIVVRKVPIESTLADNAEPIGRLLETLHWPEARTKWSDVVTAIENSAVPDDQVWPELQSFVQYLADNIAARGITNR